MAIIARPLSADEMDDAASVYRASYDDRLPWLAGRHTPEDDRRYFRTVVFEDCSVWGAFDDDLLVGILALREGWIDQLYVLPAAQGRGVGSKLLAVARSKQLDLSLWTFQRNAGARRFYERAGFNPVEEMDGSQNEEGEPVVRYHWRNRRPDEG